MNRLDNQKIMGAWYVYALAFVAALGGFLFGYDLALISGAILFVEEHFGLTAAGKGFAATSATLGCIAGPIAGFWFADYFGRKKSLFIASFFLMISAVGSAVAPTIESLNFWRWIGGLGVGLASVISPTYIAEIAPAPVRGRLVTINQLAIVVGIIASILVDYFLSFGGHWRWMFGAEAFPIVIFVVSLFFVPDSPRWLAMKERTDEAEQVLSRISGPEAAALEMVEIQKELKRETGSIRELFSPGILKALMIGCLVMVYGQFVGVNMLHLYAPSIMLEIGIGSASTAILNAFYIDLFMVICVLVAFWSLDRFGRRANYYLGCASIAISHIIMAICIAYEWPSYVFLIAIMLGIGVYQFTLGPLNFVINSEIYPNRIRGKAMSIAMISLYLSNYLGNLIFPPVSEWFTETYGNTSGVYLIFAVICLSGLLFTWKLLPETKDVPLERVGEIWK